VGGVCVSGVCGVCVCLWCVWVSVWCGVCVSGVFVCVVCVGVCVCVVFGCVCVCVCVCVCGVCVSQKSLDTPCFRCSLQSETTFTSFCIQRMAQKSPHTRRFT